ncbi:MAG: GntR family transcriptional regulator [Vulcanimicrobiaceae bacterium]
MGRRLPPGADEPLYIRLKRALRERIGAGLVAGDIIPSEAQLCKEYRLSRMTVRLALSALVNEGVVVRRQGKGTFVAEPKRTEIAAYFGSFTEEVRAQGRAGGTKLVSFEIVHADPRVAAKLRLNSDEEVLKIRRVRYVDGEPVCYQVSYLARATFPALSGRQLARGSLYEHLEGTLGEALADAEESVEAMRADPYRAKLLGIKAGAPLLVIERLVFSQSGLAAEFNRSFYRAESVRLLVRSRRALDGKSRYRLSLSEGDKATVQDD